MILNRFPRSPFRIPSVIKGVRSAAFVPTAMLTASSVWVQNGKTTAKIIDAKTGEPLIHAVVQIVQNRMGALTKDDGVATIINVPPDENYTVVAKYAGYVTDTVYHVK